MKLRLAAAVASVAWAATGAHADLLIEPLQLGGLRLDAVYGNVAGVEARLPLRLGLGMTWVGPHGLHLGVGFGRASVHTDFGLLDGSQVRLERADSSVELRWRPPLALRGVTLQVGAGLGRLTLRYHPEALRFALGGETFEVALDEVSTWTRHLATELVYALPANAHLALRTAWTFYGLDVATPFGEESRAVSDLQSGVLLRVPVW
ncbi:MAG: hypothetical protein JSW67_05245 [Candidatus Latescibacterota bacterium]|nr:MAG: hypothetical protein JSW67_05245 [Candidatus Latescibacterota bacterium]